jgi:serine/threonine-protein kinase HipA
VTPVRLLHVFLEPEEGRRLRVGRLARVGRELLFEYDSGFLATGLELSVFKLPARPGVQAGEPTKFDGLMGVFDDSLPDGWGRLLIDRRAAKQGIDRSQLTPLDRLALVGASAMGALVYEPEQNGEPPSVVHLRELEVEARAVLRGATAVDLDRLIALGGSPQGARPKLLVQLADDGAAVFGDARWRPGCVHHLVKFRSEQDDTHAGTLEHAYLLMATAAGIETPPSLMLGRTSKHPGYFAVRRFDRAGPRKLHLHTLAGLLHAPPGLTALSYRDLLVATRQLTRSESAVAQMFRRACFNVFAHNRDDHSRNFAFLMDERGRWQPSPAYDLTFSEGPGGEHTLLVDGEGLNPSAEHLQRLAASMELKHGPAIIDDVRSAVSRFARFAEEAGLPARRTAEVAKRLGAARPRANRAARAMAVRPPPRARGRGTKRAKSTKSTKSTKP